MPFGDIYREDNPHHWAVCRYYQMINQSLHLKWGCAWHFKKKEEKKMGPSQPKK